MDDRAVVDSAVVDETSAEFLGRWGRLISTTNWEKGRIISQWRGALTKAGASAADRSDETWSRMVGNITPQHSGRLRRTYDRFGATADDYTGLFWSHFQAALDWNDAEMWLEGALLNSWAVVKMREQRWEAHGRDPQQEPQAADVVTSELDEDAGDALENVDPLLAETRIVQDVDAEGQPQHDHEQDSGAEAPQPSTAKETSTQRSGSDESGAAPLADLPQLPDDMAEAFDAFKVAIVRHRMDGWREVSLESTLTSLDALRELALAPGD